MLAEAITSSSPNVPQGQVNVDKVHRSQMIHISEINISQKHASQVFPCVGQRGRRGRVRDALDGAPPGRAPGGRERKRVRDTTIDPIQIKATVSTTVHEELNNIGLRRSQPHGAYGSQRV